VSVGVWGNPREALLRLSWNGRTQISPAVGVNRAGWPGVYPEPTWFGSSPGRVKDPHPKSLSSPRGPAGFMHTQQKEQLPCCVLGRLNVFFPSLHSSLPSSLSLCLFSSSPFMSRVREGGWVRR